MAHGPSREEARRRPGSSARSRSSGCSRTSRRTRRSSSRSSARRRSSRCSFTRTSRRSTTSAGSAASTTSRWSSSRASICASCCATRTARTNRFRCRVVLSILGELCDALDYAHTVPRRAGQAAQIVHRDISPSNMIVAHTGHIKVIDFGIAKANSRQLHTESGQVKGKLGYMSPEAALGMQIEPVVRRVLDGRRRVGARHRVAAVLRAHRLRDDAQDPRGRGRRRRRRTTRACPPELDRLILSALERESTRRLASAGAVPPRARSDRGALRACRWARGSWASGSASSSSPRTT